MDNLTRRSEIERFQQQRALEMTLRLRPNVWPISLTEFKRRYIPWFVEDHPVGSMFESAGRTYLVING